VLALAGSALVGEGAAPPGGAAPAPAQAPAADAGETWQGCAVLTVAEGKRLIAKAVPHLPVVRRALESGTVIVTTGTTNTYVAEELLGEKIEPGAFVTGRTAPAKGGRALEPKGARLSVVVLRKGRWEKEVALDQALKDLKAGDVVIKGANMLDYDRKVAGVLIGSREGGTTGKFWPLVVARKAQLVIPVGLEKLCPGEGRKITEEMRRPVRSLGRVPSMFEITGEIVTELEALKLLANVDAFQAAAGGIGGAEGGRWLVYRGTKENVEKAAELLKGIQGEPPFAGRD
jgi:hypothetical protein